MKTHVLTKKASLILDKHEDSASAHQLEKQNVKYSYNGLLFDSKKEWSTDIHY